MNLETPPSNLETDLSLVEQTEGMNEIVAESTREIMPGLYDAIKILVDDGQSPEMIQRYAYIRKPEITQDMLIRIRMTAEHLKTEKGEQA